MSPTCFLHYSEPLHIVRGEGTKLYDSEGREYIDAYNNVPSVGHGNAYVADALARQPKILNTHTRYLNEEWSGIQKGCSQRCRFSSIPACSFAPALRQTILPTISRGR